MVRGLGPDLAHVRRVRERLRVVGAAALGCGRMFLENQICSGRVYRIGRLGIGKQEIFWLAGLPDTVKLTVSTRPQAGSVAVFPAFRTVPPANPLHAPRPGFSRK